MIRPLLHLALLGLLVPFVPLLSVAGSGPRPDEVTDLVAEITRARDEADPDEIVRLANYRNEAALAGLLEVYDSMGSIFMKREVVRALALLDGVAEAEQQALQKIMDVATTSEEPELREAALESLGGCDHLGKSFLEMIVESGADDDVREQAMRLHVARADEADLTWYRKLFDTEKSKAEPKKDKKKKGKKKKGAEDDEDDQQALLVHRLATVRELAFDALADSLEVDELVEATEDRWWGIRALSLEKLYERDPRKGESRAREAFDSNVERQEVRAVAARVLAQADGAKVADELIEVADKHESVTSIALKMQLAAILAEIDDPKLQSKLAKRVGKGKKAQDKIWVLRAVTHVEDPKLYKKIVKLLSNKDPDVRMAACRCLAERKEVEALPALEKTVETAKDPLLVAAALDAISTIRGADPEWEAQLVEYAENADKDVRNAALMQLGERGDAQYMELFGRALSDVQWSTRLAALRALELMREKEGVPLIIARMPEEQGRMQHEFADVLFNLTGMPFRTAVGNWKAWWERDGAEFEVISQSELKKRREEEDERRLRQITNVKFFGIRIISHRVIFIIDVSGSMAESMRARYAGETASDTRLSVAQRELKKCIDGLDRNALFNLITFSNGADSWLDEGITGSTEKSRDEAKSYVDRLGAMGATNLYDALRLAFDDPEVDTIFVLSDGEPTAGAQTDPGMIRQHVEQWNDHRGVVINCISVGLQLKVLQWLAEDTGGKYVQFF